MAQQVKEVGALVGGKVAYAAVVLIGAVNPWLTSKGRDPWMEDTAAAMVFATLKGTETYGLIRGGIIDPDVTWS